MIAKLETILLRYEKLNELLADPEVLSKMDEWKAYAKERADMEETVEKYKEYKAVEKEKSDAEELLKTETDAEMKELTEEEILSCKKRLEEIEGELKVLLIPKDPNDDKNVILEIRAGAGGEEAALFAYELYRMYVKYAERHRFKTEEIDSNNTELGGIKEVTFSVGGKGVYSKLKYESGVHRVQRVPETESQGRIHTSTATVAVLPEVEDVEVNIEEKDLIIETCRSSGAGGQHINKTESAIRITHIPTGIIVACQNERSQVQNKEMAMRMLMSKLIELREQERLKEAQEIKGDIKKIEFGSQIRSYVFCPYTMVKDHRTGYETGNIQAVMDGDLDGFITEYLKRS